MTNEFDPTKDYWAAAPVEDCVARCIDRTEEYYRYINEKGIKFVWMMCYLMSHSATERQTLTTAVGEYSEFQQVRVNEFRSLIHTKANIIKNQRASWEPMAVNNDVDSLAQTKIAKSVLDMYVDHKGYDHQFNKAIRYACLYGEAFLFQYWDKFKGKITAKIPTGEVDEETNVAHHNTYYEGDVELRVYEPLNVIRDCYITDHDQNHWYIFRDRANKWDLAAKYPHLAEQIVKASLTNDYQEYNQDITPYQKSQDLVQLYCFVHKPCAALPQGRMIWYVNQDVILESTTLPYTDVPFKRLEDTPIPGYNFSYTDAFDLLQVEDLTDGLWSTIITNQSMFGIQNILLPKGSDISEMDIQGAMKVIEYDPAAGNGAKPEALQLCATPKEIFQSLEILEAKKGIIMGVNSTAQGQPPNDVSSGVAISMLQSLNVQYNQGLQGSYVEAMTYVGTALINLLKQYANSERLIEYTGASNRSLLQKFTSKDLNSVVRVIAKPANPLSQTIQGRFTVGEMLLQTGLVKNAQELLEVLETGELDSLIEPEEMSLLYIQQENESMQDGNAVQCSPLDDHMSHIKQHIVLISDISVRSGNVTSSTDPQTGQIKTATDPQSNPKGQQILQIVQSHIMEHLQYLQNPQIAQMTAMIWGGPPGPPQAPPGAPGAAHPPQAPSQAQVHHTSGPKPPQAAVQGPQVGSNPSPAPGSAGERPGQIPQAAITAAANAHAPQVAPQ